MSADKFPKHHVDFFDILTTAFENGNVAMALAVDAATGEDRTVICVMHTNEKDETYFLPIGHMALTDDPQTEYKPKIEPRRLH